ncbi:MAG: anhydro-N-acetylmuramic acid kinase [Chitinophagales bacterium]|nr:MAG: anhydro-N-acetylmuramic acid kinase [Chitinophagales bacterium]
MKTYKVIGLMSGTSMDGLDIAYCHITEDNGKWSYTIPIAETIPYPPKWKLRLEQLVLQNAVTYLKTDAYLGHYFGNEVNTFIERHHLQDELDFICSHGQTIFHQPENRFTSQIGAGSAIAALTGFPVICDFRSVDVALGGQGTPIVPVADKLLFHNYTYLLNLGGIANITAHIGEKYIAFDVTPVNLILNKVAKTVGKDYDHNGDMARSGSLNQHLLDELNASWYYDKDYPKSMSGGWVSKVMWPVVSRHNIPAADKLRTLCEHIAYQLSRAVERIMDKEKLTISKADTMLTTGGGALNKFLIERISEKVPMTVDVPDEQTVKYKEALMIALMGILRVRDELNCFSSVTGASRDSIGGTIYQGHRKLLKTHF